MDDVVVAVVFDAQYAPDKENVVPAAARIAAVAGGTVVAPGAAAVVQKIANERVGSVGVDSVDAAPACCLLGTAAAAAESATGIGAAAQEY